MANIIESIRKDFEDYKRLTDEDREIRYMSIYRMVRDEPEWAASRIQHMNEAIPAMLEHIDSLEKNNG